MSGICDMCKRNRDCRRPMDGMDSCRLYVSGKESNYKKLFGTPERAARTLGGYCYNMVSCAECGIGCDGKRFEDGDALLEWLRGDAK